MTTHRGVLEILLKTVNVPQKRDVKGEKTAAVILKRSAARRACRGERGRSSPKKPDA